MILSSKTIRMLFFVIVFCIFTQNSFADSYGTFITTRYYSKNRRFFVEVTEKKRATLYKNNRRKLTRIWRQKLEELPGHLYVSNDGKRIAIIDFAYGNNRNGNAKVVVFLDEKGSTLSEHSLESVANLKEVLMTISQAHWFLEAAFNQQAEQFIIKTAIQKRKCPDQVRSEEDSKLAAECFEPKSYEELNFDLRTGNLTSRRLL